MAFDPEEDAQFQDLVRKLAPARRRKRLAEEVEATFDARSPFAPDPDLFRENQDDEFEDSFYIRDFLKPGPGLADDGRPDFWLPFLDLGNGEVDLRVTGASGVATFTRATTATTFSRSNQYINLPGQNGNYASTPNAAANQLIGDIDIRMKLAAQDWTPASNQILVSKWGSEGNQSYELVLETSGKLILTWTSDGTTDISKTSTAATGATDGSSKWVRATLDVDNGATGNDVKFYTSDDGAAWVQLGTTITTAGVTSIFSGTAELTLGGRAGLFTLAGKIHYAEIRNGINGPVVAKFDPRDAAYRATSWAASTGETWTVNSAGFGPGGNGAALVQGEIVSVASGTPRSYYEPSTGVYRGFRQEEAGTNLVTNSEAVDDASWVKTDTTITADQTRAPDGTLGADLLTEGVAGTAAVRPALFTITSGAFVAAGMWMKRSNGAWVKMNINDSTFAAGGAAWFNLSTGALGSTATLGVGSNVSSRMVAYPNGWYWCEMACKVNGGFTSAAFYTHSASADASSTRVNNDTRFQWGAQAQDSTPFCTSYIPTGAAAVTRNTDRLNYPVTWLNQAALGVVVEFQSDTILFSGANTAGIAAHISDNSYNNRTAYYRDASKISATAYVGGPVTLQPTAPAVAVSTSSAKLAAGFAANNANCAVNGTLSTADVSGAMPTGMTRLDIGGDHAGSNSLNGTVKDLKVFGFRPSDQRLQTLTA